MKATVTSFDCLAIAREMDALQGARFDKAYQPARDEVVMRLRLAGEGAHEWRVKAGRWAYLSQGTKDWPESITPFAQQLRSHLDGARLTSARQVGFDRVLELEFQSPRGTYLVACELFGDGNVVLVKEGKIMQPLRYMRVAHRTIGPGEPWTPPPARLHPGKATDEELETALLGSKADVVRTLATAWNLGGQYAEEVCARAGVDKKTKATKATPEERAALSGAVRALFAQMQDRPEPVLVRDGERLVDASPVPLVTLEAHSFEARGTFQQALEDYFTQYAAAYEAPEDPRLAALRAEQDRLRRQVEAQEASLAEFDAVAQAQHALGDMLYARYQEVEALLAQARDRLAKGGFAALESWVGQEDQPAPFRVVGVDPAHGLFTVEIEGQRLVLAVGEDVNANAQRLYGAAKKQREKADGARTALVSTKAQVEALERDGLALSDKLAKERARRRFEPTKRFWFETYRWFVSSEGHLVLGGRDAGSNDKLVKKHLEPNDRYVHADTAGAPSIVVKKGDMEEVGEATLQEAAEFAIAYSKAWQRRIGSADAYWVTPEQVSKTPQAGEFLGKGAFIIRGKRNYVNCELRCAVGETEVLGQRKVMGGPVASVQARSQRYVVLEPGTEDANALARRLGEAFQVPVEEIQAVLPPGPVRVVAREGVLTEEL